ncbi:MAG: hypothetical protein II999_08440 [Bacteroidaceae bacterium]|nr:hypothetical protein [Bacteroidaceae bacterium]
MKNIRENKLMVGAYVAPHVEIIEVAVEKGFASSGDYEVQTLSGSANDADKTWWFD